jgi:dihydroorotase-like cyclic amidohydrolase
VKIFMGASTGSLLVAHDEELARVLASGVRRVAIHAEDEDRMNARKDLRVEGDAASHPVWRDDESALLATKRILRLAARRAPDPHPACDHARRTGADQPAPRHRELRGDAPAPHPAG